MFIDNSLGWIKNDKELVPLLTRMINVHLRKYEVIEADAVRGVQEDLFAEPYILEKSKNGQRNPVKQFQFSQ
jgi:hypothetical protein